jgi:dTDP-glucose 4,6-dehydratase
MKILITGSMGVIGSKLFKKLKEQGHDVFGLDLFHCDENYGHGLGKVSDDNYFRCDISEYRQVERIVNYFNPDIVYNCAAEFGRWNGEHFYENVWKSNAIGTKNIIRLQEQKNFRLVHCSSSEVYGDYSGVMYEDIVNEISIVQMNDYAMSKRVNEMQIMNSRKQFGTETVAVRFFNTYGPGEWYHPFRSVNCVFCYNLLHNQPIVVFEGHMRTSTYIDDAVHTFANIVDNFNDGEVYNITSDYEHTIEELAGLVLKYTKADPALVTYRKQNEVLTTLQKKSDSKKSKEHLGHRNTVTLEEGVKNTVEWMRGYYA